MRNFSKKLAFVLAAAMVFTAFAPAAKAEAAEEMAINRKSQTLYVNEGINNFDSESLADGLTGNKQEYDFYVANKPADWKTAYTFDWSSSDEKVMTVGKAGLATAVAVGKADVKCVVTEKATGKTTTLTATVTVKANADELVITNAADFDAQTVKAGDEVALEYEMVAEGGKATDLVRWVAEPATGVTVEDGVFTFGEDAIPGDYVLYGETYQSDKYNATTATSEKVVVTYVADNTFEVKQDAEKQITVKFDAPVKSLTRDDVVINRLYKGFELPVLVNKATLAEDGMSATITLFTALLDKHEYVVNIAGYETADLTASVGEPVEVLLFVDEKTKNDPGELVYIDGSTNVVTLDYRLMDAKGVDVTETAKKNGTLFVTADVSPEYKYFVTDGTIWFADENVEVTVNAEFQVFDNATGTLVSPAKGQKLFISQKEAEAQVLGVVDWKIGGTWDDPKKSLPLDEKASLEIKLGLTKGNPLEIDADKMLGFTVGNTTGWIRYEELNANVAAMDGNVIKYFKQDVAKILVYFCYEETDGTVVELPLYQVNAQAKAAKKLATANLSQQTITIGTVAGDEGENFDKATITIVAKDNYTNDFSDYKVEVTGNDDKTKAVLEKDSNAVVVGSNTIDFYGAKLKAATEGTPASAQLNFKVTITSTKGENVKIEKNVTVVYKSEGTVLTKRIEADGFGVDVARTAKDANTQKAKEATFTVYQYSNGIKVDTVEVEKYNANNITGGKFYFKVTKDNKDITDSTDISAENGVITLKFSGVDETTGVVTYGLGAGNYAVTLFEGTVVNGKGYPRPVSGASAYGTVTCNVGSYGAADLLVERLGIVDLANADDAVIQAAVRDAFSIKNAQNAEATKDATLYEVAYEVTDRYVYVKTFTFLDEVGTGEYAMYTVQVNRAILN